MADTTAPVVADWRTIITDSDRKRLREWRIAFIDALENVRGAGQGGEIAREGVLLQPDTAITGRPITAGRYRCRIFKLGARSEGMRAFTRYPDFDCEISDEGEVLGFAKIGGSQRPVGLLFNDDDRRQIFLGTLMLGDEKSALDYGRDTERDIVGIVEMVGPGRWRMLLPYPHFESRMDVVELVPHKS